MNLTEALTLFFDRRHPAPATKIEYQSVVNLIGRFAEARGLDPLDVFTEDHASGFHQWLRLTHHNGKARANSTVVKIRTFMTILWKFLFRRKIVSAYPMDPADWPRCVPVKRKPVAWTVQEFQAILSAIPGYVAARQSERRNRIWNVDRWTLFLKVMWFTGARPAALLKATPADLEGDILTLRGENDKASTEHRCKLPANIVDGLLALPMLDGFRTFFPACYSKSAFNSKLHEIIKAAGLPISPFYSGFKKVRKTHLTHLAAARGLEAAASSVDHSNAGITLEHYVDPTQQPKTAWPADVLPAL